LERGSLRSDDQETLEVQLPEAMLRAAIDRFTDHAFVTLDGAGIVTSWSVGAERLFGYAREHIVGQHVSVLFTLDDCELGIPVIGLQQAQREGSVSASGWARRADGGQRYVTATLVAVRPESATEGFVAIAHEARARQIDDDIQRARDTLVARVEESARMLAESKELLATEVVDRTQAEAARVRLLRRLVMVQEEERRRIARELHDDLGQRLTALRLTLEALTTPEQGSFAETVANAIAMLARIDQGLDFLAWELRPAALDELGLAKVLDRYVTEWSQHAGVEAVFHAGVRDADRFPPEVEASVYRIAQEALNNVAKHAHARSVNVLLEQRGEQLVLVVEDDGVGCQGIDFNERMNGLAGMRERATAISGTLEIEPTPNGGTTVLAQVPVSSYVHGSQATRRHERRADGNLPAASAGARQPAESVLTSLRARLQELQHAVAARDDFVATVAHELRNPVAPLMFQIRLAIERSEQVALAGQPLSAEWFQSQLRRVEQRLHRLLETLDRLLDVSRLSTGRVDLQYESMNLAQTVREILGTFEAELAVARCKLTLVEGGDAVGWWDRVRVEQICRNLLSNAIRFGAGRPIEVSVGTDQDFATLQVRDHGPGIAFDHQTRIFERFERGADQRSGGFGIGLWVVKNLCVAMGGTISVESTPGEGALFTVMLPRRSSDPAHKPSEDT
jgi:PAS domain S-box-containing protein